MLTDSEIDDVLLARQIARAERNWTKSDELRKHLLDNGVTVIDTPKGQVATGGTLFRKDKDHCYKTLLNKIDELELIIKILRHREAYAAKQIADLVKEVLKLRYGEK